MPSPLTLIKGKKTQDDKQILKDEKIPLTLKAERTRCFELSAPARESGKSLGRHLTKEERNVNKESGYPRKRQEEKARDRQGEVDRGSW